MAVSTPNADLITTVFTPSTGSTLWECVDDFPGTGDYIEGLGNNEELTVSFEITSIIDCAPTGSLEVHVTASNSPFVLLKSYTIYDNASILASEDNLGEYINDSAHTINIPIDFNSLTLTGNTSLELTFDYMDGGPYGIAIYGIRVNWTYVPPPIPSGARAAALALLANWPN